MTRQERLDEWLRMIVKTGRDREFDDLHIDQIDQGLRDRSTWVNGALDCLGLALSRRDQLAPGYTLALAFSLRAGESPRGFNLRSIDDLPVELNAFTPPSFYIFRNGEEPWAKPDSGFHEQVFDVRRLYTRTLRAYSIEFKPDESDECSRSLFLAG